MRPTTVVSSANLMMWLELNLAVQSWVSSMKSSGLSTQPCGAPVLSVVVLEVLWPTWTDWGLPVKKSRIQLQRELLRPSRFSLFMSCCGIVLLYCLMILWNWPSQENTLLNYSCYVRQAMLLSHYTSCSNAVCNGHLMLNTIHVNVPLNVLL